MESYIPSLEKNYLSEIFRNFKNIENNGIIIDDIDNNCRGENLRAPLNFKK